MTVMGLLAAQFSQFLETCEWTLSFKETNAFLSQVAIPSQISVFFQKFFEEFLQ